MNEFVSQQATPKPNILTAPVLHSSLSNPLPPGPGASFYKLCIFIT
jgi:hypothetical protein